MRVSLSRLPFRIGRSPELDLVLESPRVSKLHAEIDANGRGYLIRDLGSRNGTFVNGDRLAGERHLELGDVVHVAHRELALVQSEEGGVDDSTLAGRGHDDEAAFFKGARDIHRILRGRSVRAVFQAVTSLADGGIVGYEALGRHTLSQASYDATTLFRIAHERGKAVELSQMMRRAALADVPALPAAAERVFMNVHPAEMLDGSLLEELERTADALGPGRCLVAEIHESAIVEPSSMRALKRGLSARGIELAYDDFGAGRARLMELAEVPPDFLKLDMSLVRDIDRSPNRQDLVAALVHVMREAGVRVVAEGIESERELHACRALGCELGQGFFIRRPAPVADLRATLG